MKQCEIQFCWLVHLQFNDKSIVSSQYENDSHNQNIKKKKNIKLCTCLIIFSPFHIYVSINSHTSVIFHFLNVGNTVLLYCSSLS